MKSTPLLFALLLLSGACGDGTSSGGGEADAAAQGDPDAAVEGGADAAAGEPDASIAQTCEDLGEGACEADEACAPSCTGLCDCSCPGNALEACEGCAECPAECFEFSTCVKPTPCGEGVCDPRSEICVEDRAWTSEFRCDPLPQDCEEDRSCSCAGEELCTDAFNLCADDPAENKITCECPAC